MGDDLDQFHSWLVDPNEPVKRNWFGRFIRSDLVIVVCTLIVAAVVVLAMWALLGGDVR
jgi:hypothetical protein